MAGINTGSRPALLEEAAAELSRTGTDTPELDAQLLLSHALGVDRVNMLANPHLDIGPSAENAFRRFLARRAAGEPVAYITGLKEFYKHAFAVNRSVLIPRPETEVLVEETLRKFGGDPRLSLLDVGAGCGCIALSLAAERPGWDITATDISQEALSMARHNGKRLGVENVKFILSDLFSAVDEKFDVIVSNPPYVDEAVRQNLQVELREYEPATALFTTEGGLKVIRELVRKAPGYLKPGGFFICEIGYDQRQEVEKLFDAAVWSGISFHHDLHGHMRVVSAVYKMELQRGKLIPA